MKQSDKPLLSVIVGMPGDNSEYLTEVIRCMAAQSIASQIEVVIPTASIRFIRLPAEGFPTLADVRVIEIGPFKTFADGMVPGIHAARADIVVLWEDHAFAGPGWAEAVVAAHAQGYAAVGASMENANPWSGRSWTHILFDYGRFLRGEPAGEKTDLPGHNSSYLRSALLTYPKDSLHNLIEEFTLHADLRKNGHRLFLASDAICWHQNPSKWLASAWIRFSCHRRRADMRANTENWPLLRRWLYALLWPIISIVRLRDVWSNVRRQNRWDLLKPRIITAVALFSIVNGLGEMYGFLFGSGDVAAELAVSEFARYRQMCRADLIHPPVGGAHQSTTPIRTTAPDLFPEIGKAA